MGSFIYKTSNYCSIGRIAAEKQAIPAQITLT